MITDKFYEAIEFAALAHKDQFRKGEPIPYISHPFAVSTILREAGYSDDVIIAGILHDVIEDTTYSLADIEKKFGDKVTKLVLMVTEDASITSRSERVKKYLENVKNSSIEVKAISAADMLHNRLCALRELKNGVKIWDIMKITKEKYLESSYKKLNVIKTDLNDTIVQNLEKILKEIEDFK